MAAETAEKPVLLFDGVCNLCNSSVQFVIDHDPDALFSFASLQSAFGQKALAEAGLPTDEISTIVLLENKKVYNRSTAALRIAKHLSFPYPLLYAFIIVPSFIRNAVYDFIAKNRYKWFGQTEACRVMTPELKHRFLNDNV